MFIFAVGIVTPLDICEWHPSGGWQQAPLVGPETNVLILLFEQLGTL